MQQLRRKGAAKPRWRVLLDRYPRYVPVSAAAAVCVLGGIAVFWAVSGSAFFRPKQDPATVSELSEVAEQDVAGALTTLVATRAITDRYKVGATGCRQPLAWVTLTRRSGPATATIRLRSGDYFSPVFKLADKPMKVAVPFPAPYQTGEGKLLAIEVGADTEIALAPSWRVYPQKEPAVRLVVWKPNLVCHH